MSRQSVNQHSKINIADLDAGGIESVLAEMGEKKFRAKQIFKWIHSRGVFDFSQMTDLSKELREKLSAGFDVELPEIAERHESGDGLTVKYAFCLRDAKIVEAVKIYDDEKLDKYTLCISTQVGCPIGCAFCQTGRMKFARDLKTSEIIGQVLKIAFENGPVPAGVENYDCGLSNVVYMGMGEPLLNYENVMKSVRLINARDGLNISMRKITVSTCGVVPAMERLMDEKLQLTLAVSLHAPFDDMRDKLVPLNKKYDIARVLATARKYASETSRRITFEYVMIKDVNDSAACAKKLSELLKGMLCHVNLINMNRNDSGYHPSPHKKIMIFKQILAENNINVTLRRSRGEDIDAACGMLYKKLNKTDTINREE